MSEDKDKYIRSLRDMPFTGENSIFKFLEGKLSLANLTEKERDAYEEELKVARDNYAVLNYAISEARAEGLAEGLAECRTECRAEGRAEGVLDSVRKLLSKGKSKEEIVDLLDVDPAIFASL